MKQRILAVLALATVALGLMVSPAAADTSTVSSFPIFNPSSYCGHHTVTAVHNGDGHQNASVSAEAWQGPACASPINFSSTGWISSRFWIECSSNGTTWTTKYTSPIATNVVGGNSAVTSKSNTSYCDDKLLRVKQQSGFLLIDGWHYYVQYSNVVGVII